MKTVSIINLKGGVGKSTLAMILAEFLVFRYGKKVLLVDMDAQGNLSYCMIPAYQIEKQEREGRTVYHLLKAAMDGKKVNYDDFITKPPMIVSNISRAAAASYPGVIDMIVSVPTFAELDEVLLNRWESGLPMPTELRMSLGLALKSAEEKYDYVLIDCPPGLSIFSSTALMASDYYISPVIPEPLSLQGVDLVQQRAAELRNKYSLKLQFKGIVLNVVKHYRGTHQHISEMIYTTGADRYQPFQFWLPDSERLRRIGEFDAELVDGTWAGGREAKFSTYTEKYSMSYRLSNPKTGVLNRSDVEGLEYKLEERISNLVGEFEKRCR